MTYIKVFKRHSCCRNMVHDSSLFGSLGCSVEFTLVGPIFSESEGEGSTPRIHHERFSCSFCTQWQIRKSSKFWFADVIEQFRIAVLLKLLCIKITAIKSHVDYKLSFSAKVDRHRVIYFEMDKIHYFSVFSCLILAFAYGK